MLLRAFERGAFKEFERHWRVGMARGPIAAAMVGKTIGKSIDEQELPVYVERFDKTKDEIFVTAAHLRRDLGDAEFEKVPAGALGLYTYYERIAQGLRQLMAGSRRFGLKYMSRDDLASLTPEVARVSGIPLVSDCDEAEAEEILSQVQAQQHQEV